MVLYAFALSLLTFLQPDCTLELVGVNTSGSDFSDCTYHVRKEGRNHVQKRTTAKASFYRYAEEYLCKISRRVSL